MADLAFFSDKRNYDNEQVTVSSSAVSLTTAKVDNTANYPDFKAQAALIGIPNGSNAIYYTLDGSTPSSTNGQELYPGDVLPISGYQKIKNFKAIRQSSDAVLNVQYFNR